MIKELYNFIRNSILLILGVFISLIFILEHPEILSYFADKLLKKEGITYEDIEGSFLSEITLHNVKYKKVLNIKSLSISYKIPKLLLSIPEIDTLSANHVEFMPDNLNLDTNNSDNNISLPSFSIDTLSITDLSIVTDENIKLDFYAKNITFIKDLDIRKLSLKLNSKYTKLTAKGYIEKNKLITENSIYLKEKLVKILYPIKIPSTLNISLQADKDNISIETHLSELSIATDDNITIHDILLYLNYTVKNNYFTFQTDYLFDYATYRAKIEQNGIFTSEGAYSSNIEGLLIQDIIHLPFKNFTAEASGDIESIIIKAYAGPLNFLAQSDDYINFSLHSNSPALSLSFYPELPDIFQNNIISYETNASLKTSPFSLKGDIFTEGVNTTFTGNFNVNEKSMLYKATLNPKNDSTLFKDYQIEKISPINIMYYKYQNSDLFNIDANLFNLTLFKNHSILNGWGNLATTTFNTHGNIKENGDMNLTINSSIPSLYTLASEIIDFQLGNYEFYDAQLDLNATLNISDTFKITSDVNLPWYVGQLDSQTHYFGKDLFLEATAEDNILQIGNYKLDIMNHIISSDRTSKFSLDDNGTIDIQSLWIFNNLLLTGSFNLLTHSGKLNLSGKKVNYEGVEGNITADIDITATFDSNQTQTIEGNIDILDGTITYASNNNYSILDEDIIIIQDIKEPSNTVRSINISINSEKPITYKHGSIEVELTPNFTIYQEPFKPLELLGMIHIGKGEINTNGKLFEIQESDIYLQGDTPINPYLNLHIQYTTIDYINIDIIVANTLNSPVILFTSSPPMSQNDILSYLLFGGPATSTFESSNDSSTSASIGAMLLGTGLKTIFTDSTGVKVDTLNILTNKEGNLGYEIGARFSKEIRLVYKNDTISSIILQYSLNRSLRIDVDVHETGQGVNLLYIKDF